MEKLINFKDKVVIVTGASSGIGEATAILFSEYGAKVTLVGRNAERLTSVALQCLAKSGFQPLCLQLDLTDRGSCQRVVSATAETYGRIDVLVNCAGISGLSSIFDNSMYFFDEIMAINLRVPVSLSQLVVRHLIKTKGNIVNVTFSVTNKFRSGSLFYNMSKTALERFTKLTAPELVTEGVRINCVSAGYTKTNIYTNDGPSKDIIYDGISKALPCGKVLEPKEVAINICYVASDVLPYLNGASFVIDGGSSLA